jgi:RHH-type proline utilization regulon transcriptional repressor/proline dehydrogenase/delta 1-pyrroline-5-carboxylate dehydrogenase
VDGALSAELLQELTGFDAVVSWADAATLRALRQALANRPGALVPLVTDEDFGDRCHLERHVCVDTTASGGNAALLAQAS